MSSSNDEDTAAVRRLASIEKEIRWDVVCTAQEASWRRAFDPYNTL